MAINLVNDNISTIEIKGKKYNIKAIPFHGTAAEWESNDYIPKDGEIVIYDIDENYAYKRIKIGDGENTVAVLPFLDEDIASRLLALETWSQELEDNVAYISEDDNEDIVVAETASPYAGTIHRFTVEVNCAPMYIPEDNLGPEFADGTELYTDYGVLVFPKSYTDKGKKTRLVISAHGGGGTVSADSSQAEHQSISQYLVANGYAVMDVNGLPEQYALDHGNLRLQDSVGSYIAI